MSMTVIDDVRRMRVRKPHKSIRIFGLFTADDAIRETAPANASSALTPSLHSCGNPKHPLGAAGGDGRKPGSMARD